MNWILTAIFVLIFAGLFARAWKRHFSILKNAAEEIKATTVSLQQIPEEEYEIRFEEIKKLVQKNPFLSESWGSFIASLAKITENDHHKMFSPTSASDFFRFSDTTRAMNISYWQNFSGTFTGVGIGGTFLGLVIGLFNVDLASSDVLVLKEGIGNLLNGIYIAFITSLIGIVCAILYGIVHQRYIERLQKTVTEFSEHVEKMYPCISAEQWLAKSYEENSEQTKKLKTLSQDMANTLDELLNRQLGDAFDQLCENLSQKLAPVFTNLQGSIDGFNQNGVAAITTAISEQTKNQSEAFAGMQKEMRTILQDTLTKSQEVTNKNSGSMLEAIQKIGDIPQSVAQITTQMQTVLTDFRNTMEKSLKESFERQQEAAASINKEVGTRMGEQIETFSSTLQQVQSGMTETLTTLQEMNRDSKELTHNTMQNLSDALTKSAGEAAAKQQEAAENMKAQVDRTVEAWSKKQAEVADAMETRVGEILIELAQNSSLIIKKMNEIGKESQENIQAHAKEAKQAMQETVSFLQNALDAHNASMETARSRIEEICMTMSILIQEMKDSGNTFKNAAEPVEAATKELQETLHKTTKEAKTLHDTVGKQLQQLIAHGEKSEKSLQSLTTNLQEAENRSKEAWQHYKKQFDQVSGELERATEIISKRLEEYNGTMSQGMQEQFSTFAKTVEAVISKLAGAVEEFNDLAENFTGKGPNKRGR